MKHPKKKQILEAYNSANEETKQVLEQLYGEELFRQTKPIAERVKTFEDACRELGDKHELVKTLGKIPESVDENLKAYAKLRIIIAALNEGWDVREQKDGYYWRVVFRGGYNAYAYFGLAFSSAYSGASYAYSIVGSRLVFKSKELAEYCAQQFTDLWRDYFAG